MLKEVVGLLVRSEQSSFPPPKKKDLLDYASVRAKLSMAPRRTIAKLLRRNYWKIRSPVRRMSHSSLWLCHTLMLVLIDFW